MKSISTVATSDLISRCAVIGIILIFCIGSFFGAGLVYSQPPVEKRNEPNIEGPLQGSGNAKVPPTPLPTLYFGMKACASAGCHEKGQTAEPPLLCRCDELDQCKANDKHADAYAALTGELGRKMLKKLKMEEPSKATACLGCHGVVKEANAVFHSSFDPNEGVSCVVCHGAHKEWVEKHSSFLSRDEFRKLNRETKESLYGMTDLWNPLRRAQLCASCHIGNHAQGKVVTHDMYAAGHPHLPGFEITTFSDQMPRHWLYLREKPREIQKLQGHKDNNWEQAQLVLVGSAVGLAESMRLLEAQAAEAHKKDQGLDWAQFDCYACHHELRTSSWRQSRGYSGRPGRVPMKNWPTTLVKLAGALEADGASKGGLAEWDGLEKKLREAFDEKPFGNLEKIRVQAKAVADWSDRQALAAMSSNCGPEKSQKMIQGIPALLDQSADDYDSARQAAWALVVLRREEHSILKNPRPALDKLLEEIDKDMALKLPAGRKESILSKEGDLLKILYNYDPEMFKNWANRVREAVK